MYYYLNSFIIYSIMGFILESSLYKFKASPYYSGVLYGPFTIIYGFGCIFLILLDKYLFKKLKTNKFLKLLIIYLLSALTLTLTELSGGLILKYIFNTEMWNYTNKTYNIGKYICLEMSLLWGFLGVIFILYIKPFFDTQIPNLNANFTKLFIFIISLNLIITFLIKNKELILSFL